MGSGKLTMEEKVASFGPHPAKKFEAVWKDLDQKFASGEEASGAGVTITQFWEQLQAQVLKNLETVPPALDEAQDLTIPHKYNETTADLIHTAAASSQKMGVPNPTLAWCAYPSKVIPEARTQKARGVLVLHKGLISRLSCFVGRLGQAAPELRVFPGYMQGKTEYPCFARPCPTKPRHGFVESRMISDEVDLVKVIIETMAADPQGEVILMPKLTGKYSGVATNTGVTWGLGNAGVTAGHPGSVLMPVPLTVSKWSSVFHGLLGVAGIETCPYVELVEHQGRVIPVQLRDGPAQTANAAWFVQPKARGKKIKALIHLTCDWHDDLPAVERELKALAESFSSAFMRAKAVVVLPGGNLFCHAAVQALSHGFSVFCGEAPPTLPAPFPDDGKAGEAEWKPDDYRGIGYGAFSTLAHGMETSKFNPDGQGYERLAMAIATLHAHSLWPSDPRLMRFIGMAFAVTLRYVAASCLGELRHYNRSGPGRFLYRVRKKEGTSWSRYVLESEAETAAFIKEHPEYERDPRYRPISTDVSVFMSPVELRAFNEHSKGGRSPLDRNTVYDRALSLPLCDLLRTLTTAREDFVSDWNGSFGGPAWSEVTGACLDAFLAFKAFMKDPCADTWQPVVSEWNNLVNICHNGGPALTKWISSSAMDYLAAAPTLGLITAAAGEAILGLSPTLSLFTHDGDETAVTSALEGLDIAPSHAAKAQRVRRGKEEEDICGNCGNNSDNCFCCSECGANLESGPHDTGCSEAYEPEPEPDEPEPEEQHDGV